MVGEQSVGTCQWWNNTRMEKLLYLSVYTEGLRVLYWIHWKNINELVMNKR